MSDGRSVLFFRDKIFIPRSGSGLLSLFRPPNNTVSPFCKYCFITDLKKKSLAFLVRDSIQNKRNKTIPHTEYNSKTKGGAQQVELILEQRIKVFAVLLLFSTAFGKIAGGIYSAIKKAITVYIYRCEKKISLHS